MKIINFVTHRTTVAQVRSSICQTNREPLVCTVTIFSVVFRCMQLQITYFLSKDNANFVNFYQKARKTNGRALRLYANDMVFDITRVNRNLPLLLCTFGRSFQRKI